MRLYLIILCLSLFGCSSTLEKTSNALNSATVGVQVLPAAAVYGSIDSTNNAAQGASIALGVQPDHYAKTVSKDELMDVAVLNGCKFNEPWKYMGTRDGYHYLALYPFLGFRKIYRIHEKEYHIAHPFNLTSKTWRWRDIQVIEHHGQPFELIIQQSDGYVLLDRDAVFNSDYRSLSINDLHEFAPLNRTAGLADGFSQNIEGNEDSREMPFGLYYRQANPNERLKAEKILEEK